MASGWNLFGSWAYKAGANGTPAIPKGSRILSIIAHSTGAANVTINGGDALPIINAAAPTVIRFPHQLAVTTAANAVVFTGTDQYWIEFLAPAGT